MTKKMDRRTVIHLGAGTVVATAVSSLLYENTTNLTEEEAEAWRVQGFTLDVSFCL